MTAPTGPMQERRAQPAPPGPPGWRVKSADWVRANLFDTWYDSLLTVVFALFLGWAAYRAVLFVFVSAEWEIVRVNLTSYMLGRFPREELARPWVAIGLVVVASGLGAGVSARRRGGTDWRAVVTAVWPAALLVVVLLLLTDTPTPALLTAVMVGLFAGTRFAGLRLPDRAARRMPLVAVAGVFLAYAAFTAFQGVGFALWGGLLLNLFLGLGGIVLSFPLGVLLALGRRSTFPVMRLVCVGFIELIRGVPLIALLFMALYILGFFLPPAMATPSVVTRALVAMILFTAAYVAEIVRGGLQSVPAGQTEAAQAIGLSPVKVTALVVLPQALRNVIPAMVGQFISLFKDTTLVFIIGLLDILRVGRIVTQQPDFLAQGLMAESLVFVGFVFWVCCYTMSKSSQRLERRLGVGQR